MSEEQPPVAPATPKHMALLQGLARQAAAWWRKQLEDPGYLGKFNNGDTSRTGEMAQIMASTAALKGPQPQNEQLDRFEQLLTQAVWERMQRNPTPSNPKYESPASYTVLSVDYGPEGELRKVASTAGVSGFPWKTTMWVNWDADAAKCYLEVRRGYGAETQRLPTTA